MGGLVSGSGYFVLGRARAALERFASRDTSDSEKNPFSLFAPVPDLRAKCGVE